MKPTLIEGTAKRWKILILVGWSSTLGGLILMGRGFQGKGFDDPTTGIGLALAFSGVVVLIVGRIGSWWNHR